MEKDRRRRRRRSAWDNELCDPEEPAQQRNSAGIKESPERECMQRLRCAVSTTSMFGFYDENVTSRP
jgi:hypothetical protein